MTQEEKQLLLQDLCARLPYYPKCEMIDELRVVNNKKDSSYTECLFPRHLEIFYFHNNFTIKPYLRPMSSMTEEERKIYAKLLFADLGGVLEDYYKSLDYLNSIHIDYRGLIPMGLAVEVTAENNPYKD